MARSGPGRRPLACVSERGACRHPVAEGQWVLAGGWGSWLGVLCFHSRRVPWGEVGEAGFLWPYICPRFTARL